MGKFRLEVDGQLVPLAPLTTAVLVRLLLADGGLVTVSELFRDVWPDSRRTISRADRVSVQKRVSQLRRILDPQHPGEMSVVLRTERGAVSAYRLVIDRCHVDAFCFEDLVEQARMSVDPAIAAGLLKQALGLWQGRPLLDVAVRPFALDAVEHLLALRIAAAGELVQAYRDAGQTAEALQAARALRQVIEPMRVPRSSGASHDPLGRSPTPLTASGADAVPSVGPSRIRVGDASAWVGALPAVWNVPRRMTDFVPRAGLIARIRERLAAGPAALSGLGGVGKTRLAVEYAHQFADSYDLAWWLDAEQPDQLGEQWAALAVQTGASGPGAQTMVAFEAIKRQLRTFTTGRWLVIFDNVEDPRQLTRWLPDGGGHLLVTSRSPHWAETASRIAVEVFTRPQSLTLLRGRVRHLADNEGELLAQQLGDLPLALAQAAAVMTASGMTASEFLAELSSNAAAITDQGRPATYPLSLAAAIKLATDRLAAEAPVAWHLMRLCALLAPEPIPFTLLTNPLASPHTAAPGAPSQQRALRQAIGELSRYGLVQVTAEGVQLHRLVQAIIRDRLSPTELATLRSQAETLVAAADPGGVGDEPRTWRRWQILVPHLLALRPATSDSPQLRELAGRLPRYLLVRGEHQSAYQIAYDLHQQWTQRLGPDDRHTLAAATRLAMANHVLGNSDRARELAVDTLERKKRTLGASHVDTLLSELNLSMILELAGEYTEALDLVQDALGRAQRAFGADHLETLRIQRHVPYYRYRLGEVREASALLADILPALRRALGADHPWILMAASEQAKFLRELGDLGKARTLLEDSHARQQRLLGNEHTETLETAAELAAVLFDVGERRRARELAEETLTRYTRLFDDKDNRWIGIMTEILAKVMSSTGESVS